MLTRKISVDIPRILLSQLSAIFPRLKLRKCPETFVSPSGNIPAVNQKVHVLLRLCQDGRGCSEKLPNVKKLRQRKEIKNLLKSWLLSKLWKT